MDNYISKEYIAEHIKACWVNGRPKYSPELHEVLSWIDEVPSEDVQLVRHGKWIFTKYYVWKCSECEKNPTKGMGYVQRKEELFQYCPNCGARMDEE